MMDELTDILRRHSPREENATPIRGLTLHRRTAVEGLKDGMYPPSLAVAVQGRKRILIGAADLVYGGDKYLVTPVEVPVVSQVVDASAEQPFYSLLFRLEPAVVAEVLTVSAKPMSQTSPLGTMNERLRGAVTRLVSLLDTPADIPALAPLAERELVYLLASGELGQLLRWPATDNAGPGARVARAVAWLKANFRQPLRIAELAASVHTSPSSLHEHFRAATGMTPLQYQKALRLGEARRLMVVESFDAATAAYTVGYTSATQFSREYRRLYGQPPLTDARRLRAPA